MSIKNTKHMCLKILTSIGITVLLVFVLFRYISLHDFKELLRNIYLPLIILSFIPYIMCYLFRTLRFKVFLVDKNITIWQLFQVHTLHNMCNQLLPANIGELSYLFLLKKHAKIRLIESTSSLLLARFLDFTVLLFFFLVSLLFLEQKPTKNLHIIIYVAVAGFIALILSYILFNKWGNRTLAYGSGKGFLSKIMNKVKYLFNEVTLAIKKIHTRRRLLLGILFTFLSVNSLFLFYFFIIRSIGIHISYFDVMFMTSILIPLILLPTKGIAGFGTHELGWTIGFVILGYSNTSGILAGFTLHCITLIFTILLGITGYLLLNFSVYRR